jgi:hypothetical protein
MVMPYWFWFITATVGLAAIGVSALLVAYLKADEVYAAERAATARGRAADVSADSPQVR